MNPTSFNVLMELSAVLIQPMLAITSPMIAVTIAMRSHAHVSFQLYRIDSSALCFLLVLIKKRVHKILAPK